MNLYIVDTTFNDPDLTRIYGSINDTYDKALNSISEFIGYKVNPEKCKLIQEIKVINQNNTVFEIADY